jgi:oxygen-dependent protoporphyrinogen oxidase
MERRYGSLIRAARHEARDGAETVAGSGVRYGLFTAPARGIESLPAAIAARLPPGGIRLNSPIDSIARDDRGWRLKTPCPGAMPTSAWACPEMFDAVIVATPAQQSARILQALDANLAAELAAIEYAGCAVIALAYGREQIRHPLDGFGFVVPLIERRSILSASFSSVKYAGRAPQGQVLIRVFMGGACQSHLLDENDSELIRIAAGELADLLSIHGDPLFARVSRWPDAMPQYHVGHLARIARIESLAARHSGLALAGNAYRGVGIPHCIHSGEQAAERIIGQFQTISRCGV